MLAPLVAPHAQAARAVYTEIKACEIKIGDTQLLQRDYYVVN